VRRIVTPPFLHSAKILQGIADPALRLTPDSAQAITDWIEYNAEQYWLCEGGPLAPDGIDIAIIDDPQMVSAIKHTLPSVSPP
jgi:inosine-uridine nucleoside N-ribohydrolase